jgi:hypothetical protein
MDPISAIANVIAAILNYATEVRKTMSQENRDAYDKAVAARVEWWDKVGQKVAAFLNITPGPS